MNKSTTVNRFVLHTLQRYITHLAIITRKTNIKLGILKGGGGGGTGKEPVSYFSLTAFLGIKSFTTIPTFGLFFSFFYSDHFSKNVTLGRLIP